MAATQELFDAREAIRVAMTNAATAEVHGFALVGDREQAVKRAEEAHERVAQALSGKVLGKPGAADMYESALIDQRDALGQVARIDAESAEALRLRRSEDERIRQLKILNWDQLRAGPEQATEAVRDAADKLVTPLTEYLQAWARAEKLWSELGEATRAQVLAQDERAGRLRDPAKVSRDAGLPPCPLPAAALNAIVSAVPRPRFLASDHEPELGDGGVEITDVATPPKSRTKRMRRAAPKATNT